MWIIAVAGIAASVGLALAARASSRAFREDPVVVGESLSPIKHAAICVTRGALPADGRVDVPTFRAVALGTSGEAAALAFVYRGDSSSQRALASGQVRRQLGLKLRAANGCNLVYVMWRLDTNQIEASIKMNPGMATHKECGAHGYTKLVGDFHRTLPAPRANEGHSMQAAITGDELLAWVDGKLAWRGRLPAAARNLSGPSGIRSDNIAFDVAGVWAPVGKIHGELPRCVFDGED